MSAIAGVILAGGRSSRMGGGDKTMLEIAGRSLLSRSIDRLGQQVERLALNANGDPERFARFGLPVIADTVPGYAGPLAGMLSAMIWAGGHGHRQVVTAAGDSPFLPKNLVARLSHAPLSREAQIAVAASSGRRHSVFALWPVVLATALEAHLARPGAGRVDDFLKECGFVEVDFTTSGEGLDPFFNINTPQDLEIARVLATQDRG